MIRSSLFVLLLLNVLGGPVAAQTAPAASVTLSFGVVPQHAARELARMWTPMLTYLQAKTGYTFLLKTAPNIPTFEHRLAAGAYDLAYMNPYHYTVFHQHPGYVAFAKEADSHLQGILVVHKESPAQTLADLRGHTVAFPAPAAFAASVLTQAHLTQLHLPFTPVYVSSHDSVYRAVAQRLYAAGGGILRTLELRAPPVRAQLRVLWTTPPAPPHAFAAHPRVSPLVVQHVRHVMEQMPHHPDGRALLQALHFAGIEAAQDQEWAPIRTLGLPRVIPTP
jgi:phosphonate transport system substrate-binding protein